MFEPRVKHCAAAGLLAVLLVVSTGARATMVSPSDMASYCKLEAASRFTVKPGDIKMGKTYGNASGFASVGEVDRGNRGKSQFHCVFDARRNFRGVSSKPLNLPN